MRRSGRAGERSGWAGVCRRRASRRGQAPRYPCEPIEHFPPLSDCHLPPCLRLLLCGSSSSRFLRGCHAQTRCRSWPFVRSSSLSRRLWACWAREWATRSLLVGPRRTSWRAAGEGEVEEDEPATAAMAALRRAAGPIEAATPLARAFACPPRSTFGGRTP